MRLRVGLQDTDLAFRFEISPISVSRILTTWMNFLYLEFKAIDLQPSREQTDRDMPMCFKTKYPTTRLILDATEAPLETPSSLEMQIVDMVVIQEYKHTEGLSWYNPNRIHQFRFTLMADRGFDIGDECALHNIDLNIPPFRYGRGQLSATEVVQTRRIASLRIHVERAINQIKRYRILEAAVPISMTNTIDQIFYVCCTLTKFRPPLIS